jgi:hypothetical protein
VKSTEPYAYYIAMSDDWSAIAAGGSLLPVHVTGDRTQQQSTTGTQNTLTVKHAPHTILNFLATNAVILHFWTLELIFGIYLREIFRNYTVSESRMVPSPWSFSLFDTPCFTSKLFLISVSFPPGILLMTSSTLLSR